MGGWPASASNTISLLASGLLLLSLFVLPLSSRLPAARLYGWRAGQALQPGDPRRQLLEQRAAQALRSGPRLQRRRLEAFDWQLYRFYNPDVANLTELEAQSHYLRFGRAQGRVHRRLPLYLSYLGYGGLCNQLFGHIQGLALAHRLNASAITSAAWSRSSFLGKARYSKQPLGTLFDVARWTSYWGEQGLQIREVRCPALQTRRLHLGMRATL
jgi:hypothetical protein